MMILQRRRVVLRAPLVLLFSVALGCQSQSTPSSAPATPNAEAVAGQLHTIADAGTLADLKYPNFPDYRQLVQAVYEAANFTPVWMRDGQPTPQAQAMMTAFEVSRLKGLNPQDYDAERWPSRLSALKTTPRDATTVAHFDAALTVSAMRYISDLHIGRVNPKHFKFGIDVAQKSYDLPQFLVQKLLPASNVTEVLNTVEPPYFGYQRTEAALQNYLALADQDHSVPLPEVQKTLAPGDPYAGAEALALRIGVHQLVVSRTALTPILLLDDVFSELDPARSRALVAELPPGQSILTTAAPLPEGIDVARVVPIAQVVQGT